MNAGAQLDLAVGAIYGRAEISHCRRYRYRLERWWRGPDNRRGWLPFVMLNPSTADAERDDPTIRRCIGFALREGYGGLIVVNLFAWRAIKPAELGVVDEPFGLGNERAIEQALWDAHPARPLVVAAWGSKYPRKLAGLVEMHGRGIAGHCSSIGRQIMCLGTTESGQPRHPLYLAADTPLVPWEPR